MTDVKELLETITTLRVENSQLKAALRNAEHRIGIQSESLALHRDQQFPNILAARVEKDRADRLAALLEQVKQACLFDDDDGQIGITEEPTIDLELFDEICKALKP